MLSRMILQDAVGDALESYALANVGKEGFSKMDLSRAVFDRGGDERDLHEAMIIGTELMLSGLDTFLS